MHILFTFAIATLLACNPAPPPHEDATTSSTATTAEALDPTTTRSELSSTTEVSTTHASTNLADFIADPDDLPTAECDPWTQDCPAGQKCVPWAANGSGIWNTLKCVDVTGDGAPGEPCTAPEGPLAGIDDCALGSICWDVVEGNQGTCVAQCTGSPDNPSCLPGYICPVYGDGTLTLCFPSCNPLLLDCPDNKVCIPNGVHFFCALDGSGDEGQVNDACSFATACDPGLLCRDTSATSSACDQQSSGCCTPFCKLPDAPCPNPDQLCLPWYYPMQSIPPGYEDVGICGIPE